MIIEHKKILLIPLLILLFFQTILFCQENLNLQIQSKSKEIKKIKNEILNFEKNLKTLNNKEQSLLTKLNNADKQISLIEKLLNQLKYEIKLKERQIRLSTINLKTNEKKLQQLRKDFSDRLIYIYKKGDYNDIELILGSQSINQAIYRFKYLEEFKKAHIKIATEIRKKIATIELIKNKREKELHTKRKLIIDKEKNQKSLKQQKIIRSSQLRKAKKNKSNIIAQIKDRKNAIKKISELLATLEKQKEVREIEIARQRSLRGIKDTTPFWKKRGKLNWPVNGRVISKFGRHRHPTIVDHGNNYYSVYTHVSNVIVRENQYIATNSKLAEVSDSGSLSGTVLHFEIYKNKQKLNPEKWLKKRS